ncbi:MAG: UDP-2,3-diacetamido-2,3-dideoxy-D-glucuronate 2-epimerase [Smithella sp. PtaU1.Bin162]|nr:MAG: UDP-2,3-diacetamido-2,3-dideoxy-D-glucuronate 2-epimerase [Smithella sp. PtaU1.Bin162]
MIKIFLIAGARPNFMKIAPIIRACKRYGQDILNYKLIHTGQHFDKEMSQAFFDDLDIPSPDFHLNAGSGTHAVQTAKIMVAFEDVCEKERPDCVLVVGDVNSTLACSLVAKKLRIKVAHVEAGLRSFDMEMPEEINRMVTDSITDLFFVTEESGVDNLLREGKPRERIHLVGNVMIDNLFYSVEKLQTERGQNFRFFTCNDGNYAFLTLHRPSNVDDAETFREIAGVMNEIADEMPIYFPVHPRTRKMIEHHGISFSPKIHRLPPLGYAESLKLWKDARIVLTDSGGLQEETTALGVPCVTLRENTERPITVEVGTNILAGSKRQDILCAYRAALGRKKGSVPPLWDGKAAQRITELLLGNFKDIRRV